MTTRVLLAGAAGAAAGRHHQRDMFAPALGQSDQLEPAGVWPGPPGTDGHGRAAELARSLDVPLMRDLGPALQGSDAVVACLDADGLDTLLVAQPTVPVIVDKPLLLGTRRVTALGREPGAARWVAAYHSRFHPGVAALTAMARTGELGLPHALHGELFVPFGDGPTAEGDLRNVGVLALDAVAAVLGSPSGDVHAVRTRSGEPETEAWTLTVRWRPGVLVTLLVSRSRPGVAGLLHRYRLMGSEGQALVDLAAPSFTVVGDAAPVGYGPGLVRTELETLARGGPGTTMSELAAISRLVDAAEQSAANGAVHPSP